MNTLAKLFSSGSLIKILRLFYNHPETAFEAKEIAARTRTTPQSARVEINLLKSIGFLKSKKFTVTSTSKRGKKKTSKKVSGYVLNPDFQYLGALRNLIFSSAPIKKADIQKRFKGSGNIKCLVVSGIFIQDPNSRVDILIAGDRLRKSGLDKSLKIMEAELGRELSYAVYDTEEFKYRLNVYDKFVRDVLDFPHEVVIDKIGLK